jgi:two-component system, cell cycle response regulator DivK
VNRPPLVLVVDDNPTNLRLLGGILETQGYTLLEATNGAEALAVLDRELPDLVLLDIQMPDVSGTQVAQRVRTTPRTAHLKLVAITALAMPGDRETILGSGFNDYIAKPYRIADVLEKVKHWLEQ